MLRFIALLLVTLAVAAPVAAVEDTKGVAGAQVQWSAPALLVRDLDRSATWYERYLGFERVAERVDGEARSLILSRGLTLVHLRAQAADDVTGSVVASAGPFSRPRLTILVEDVDTLVADLLERGVDVFGEPQDEDDGRHRTAVVADPDGNPVLLSEPLPLGS